MTIRSAEVSRPFLPARTDYRLEGGGTIEDLHEDDVREVLGTFEVYSTRPGGLSLMDAMARALQQFRACREKRAVRERLAARRDEVGSRLS